MRIIKINGFINSFRSSKSGTIFEINCDKMYVNQKQFLGHNDNKQFQVVGKIDVFPLICTVN